MGMLAGGMGRKGCLDFSERGGFNRQCNAYPSVEL